MIKKIITGILTITLILALCACGNSSGNVSSNGKSVKVDNETKKGGELSVEDAGFYYNMESESAYVGFIVANKEKLAATDLNITITLKTADGTIAGTSTYYGINYIAGNDSVALSEYVSISAEPTTLEVKATCGNYVSMKDIWLSTNDFEVSNVNVTRDEYGYTTVTGELENKSTISPEGGASVEIFVKQNDKIVYAESEYLSNTPANSKTAFSHEIFVENLQYDEVITYAHANY